MPLDPTPARRRRAPAVAALATAAALAASLFIASPAAATDYPSWNDVVAARASQSATQSKVAELEGLITGLQTQVDQAKAAADEAWAADKAAQDALADKTRAAESLKAQAEQAAADAEASKKRAAGLAAQFARSAGNDLTSQLMVSGSGSDDLLYQLGTMSKLSETSQEVFTAAKQDQNTATALTDQAEVAEAELQKLADAAKVSLQSAIDAQKAVQSALLEQEAHQAELTVQVTVLKNAADVTEAQYTAGVEAERQRRIAEEQAAAAAAAAEAAAQQAAEEAAQNAGGSGGGGGGGSDEGGSSSGGGGGSSSGGGSGGSGGGGGGGIVVSPPAQSYSGAAVVAYAEQFVGVVPYGWGANPNDSFGCDGLTQYVYGQFGISLPRMVSNQAAMGVRVSAQDAQAGDLVVWPGAHIGIYDGDGGVIHSPDWGRYVTHATNLWGSYYFVRLV
jgi:cell wall-associated NlpC family hydrolase